MIKKSLFKIYFVACLVIFMCLAACSEEEEQVKEVIRPVKAVQVVDALQLGQRTFPGRAEATETAELAFRISGPLVEFPANVGDVVKQGDIIAKVDPRDFQVNLRAAKGRLNDALAALRRAENDYKRETSIYDEDPGATSQAAVDRKREERDRAAASVQTLRASVEAAQDQLDYTVLKAPFDGVVVSTYVENFENIQAQQPIARLVDDSRIEMVVNIPENLISFAKHVIKVFVAFDAFPDRKLEATIKEIGTEASTTTRTYPVTLIMDQPQDVKILPGMAGKTVNAEMSSEKILRQMGETGMEIPVAAVFSKDDINKTYVWVFDESSSTVKKREVKTEGLAVHGVRIKEGLSSGEWVVVAGVHYLREGQKVKLLQE